MTLSMQRNQYRFLSLFFVTVGRNLALSCMWLIYIRNDIVCLTIVSWKHMRQVDLKLHAVSSALGNRLVVSFILRPLCSRRNNLTSKLLRRLAGPRSRSAYGSQENIFYFSRKPDPGSEIISSESGTSVSANKSFHYYFTGQIKVKLSLCFNWAPRHEGVLGSGGLASRILNLRTRRR